MILTLLDSGAFWALATVALGAALLYVGDRRLHQAAIADIRAHAQLRLAQHEALPYDRERAS